MKTEVLKTVVGSRTVGRVLDGISRTGGEVVLSGNGGVSAVVDSTGETEDVELSGVGVGIAAVEEAGAEVDSVDDATGVDSIGEAEEVEEVSGEGVGMAAVEEAGVVTGLVAGAVLDVTGADEDGCGGAQSKSM